MIQFPYRFYPYALFFLIVGITMILVKNFPTGVKGRKAVLVFVIAGSVLGGIVQNATIISSEESKDVYKRQPLYWATSLAVPCFSWPA